MRRGRVLVVGAYFAERENTIHHLTQEFRRTSDWEVEQRWVALGRRRISELAEYTAEMAAAIEPKFILLNRQLRSVDLARYQYVIVCDDDIHVPPGFLDRYLATIEHCGFSLAQPARTFGSFTDHHFVTQLQGIDARETRFVEVGPLFSMRGDALPILLPFEEESPMGWGYDLVWPVLMRNAGLSMGIVDAVAVAHDLRRPVTYYNHAAAHAAMTKLIARRPSLKKLEAFSIVRSFVIASGVDSSE